MSQTLPRSYTRKPVHSKCFGIEIEGFGERELIAEARRNLFQGFWYVGSDVSIYGYDGYRFNSFEAVSQPMPYGMLVEKLSGLRKILGDYQTNETCGIHVHVSRTQVSLNRISLLQQRFKDLGEYNYETWKTLFGRVNNKYSNCRLDVNDHWFPVSSANSRTIEFRMFKSGDPEWAKECLRRTRIMVNLMEKELKSKDFYSMLLEKFTNPNIK